VDAKVRTPDVPEVGTGKKETARRRRSSSAVSAARLLNANEVSAWTGLSTDTLAQWRSEKRGIPYFKLGSKVGYDAKDVQTYLEGCRVSVSARKSRRQK